MKYILLFLLFLQLNGFSQDINKNTIYNEANFEFKKRTYANYAFSSIGGAFAATSLFLIVSNQAYKRIFKEKKGLNHAVRYLQIGIGISISAGSSFGASRISYKKNEVFFMTFAVNTLIILPSLIRPVNSVLYPTIPFITALIGYKINKKYEKFNEKKVSIAPIITTIKSKNYYGINFAIQL